MSSSRYVGRHGSQRRALIPRNLPSLSASGAARTAAKSVAGVGIVLGSGAFIVAPTSAVGAGVAEGSPSLMGEQISVNALFAERETGATDASRSARRAAPAAVTAPAAKGSGDARDTGALAVEPVAKPKPKPKPAKKPKVEKSTTDEGSQTAARSEGSESPESAESAESAGPQEQPTTSTPGASSPQQQSVSAPGTSSANTTNYGSQGAALGLGSSAQGVYSAVRSQFPSLSNIGGYRAGDPGDHGSGRAVDIMTGNGDAVAAYLQQHAGELNIKYVIWKQRIWTPGGAWKSMSDRGSATQNHFDHVHVSVN